jgi:hypothetical protein
LRGFLWFLKIWAFGSSCPTSKEEAFEKKKKKKKKKEEEEDHFTFGSRN